MISLLRFYHPDQGICLGCCIDGMVYGITIHFGTLTSWLKASSGRVPDATRELDKLATQADFHIPMVDLEREPANEEPHLLAPVDDQEVWAAGVTYERSRAARQEEAQDGGDIYARVYQAGRPELFFKAAGRDVSGPYGIAGIRADATWSVPEPELAVVMNPNLEIVGFTVGNDMCSRDIEGANPLYLPQAKIYRNSCVLGPVIALQQNLEWPETTIRMEIERKNTRLFYGEVQTNRIRRKMPELLDYLGRCNDFPNGVVLLSGTGIIPPADFSLQPGDVIQITIDGIGTLRNTVKVV